MTNDKLLEFARKNYPPGTLIKYLSFNIDAEDTKQLIGSNPFKIYNNRDISSVDISGFVYCKGRWAERIGNTVKVEINEDYNYLLKLFKKLGIK